MRKIGIGLIVYSFCLGLVFTELVHSILVDALGPERFYGWMQHAYVELFSSMGVLIYVCFFSTLFAFGVSIWRFFCALPKEPLSKKS